MNSAERQRVEAILDGFCGGLSGTFEIWPLGCCSIASLLLAPIVRAVLPEHRVNVVVGRYMQADTDWRWHCWLELEDQRDKILTIDPTHRQFDRDLPHDWAIMDDSSDYQRKILVGRSWEAAARDQIKSQYFDGKLFPGPTMLSVKFFNWNQEEPTLS